MSHTAGPVPGSRPEERLGALPIVVSVVLHGALIAGALFVRPDPEPPRPPVYRVRMEAAPPGPRRMGVVRPPSPAESRTPEPVKPTPPPPAAARTEVSDVPSAKRVPKTPPRATPNAAPTKATPNPAGAGTAKPTPASNLPTAGGGPTGGKGADVTSVNLNGIDFPFPGYLTNIINQIGARFTRPAGRQYSAEVTFLIRRDGSVAGIRISRSSGNYAFDLEAKGAVEAAAEAKAFGPLPRGFADDVLPVIFSFDPKLLR